MATWTLPAAAAAFGFGILAAGDQGEPWLGVLLVCSGGGLILLRLGWRARREAESLRLLAAAGLLAAPREPGPRERILAAAGLPTGSRDPPRPPAWRAAALVVGFLLLGAGWQMLRQAARPTLGALEGRYVEFRGDRGRRSPSLRVRLGPRGHPGSIGARGR